MVRVIFLVLLSGLLVSGCKGDPVSHRQEGAPPCQLTLTLDGKDGDFNGMSHSGTLLRLKNTGKSECHVSALPKVTFEDGQGQELPIVPQTPVGMHPGPVVVMRAVGPGQEVSGTLRWVSGNVYDPGRCFTPVVVTVEANGRAVEQAFNGQICGRQGQPATFEQGWLSGGK